MKFSKFNKGLSHANVLILFDLDTAGVARKQYKNGHRANVCAKKACYTTLYPNKIGHGEEQTIIRPGEEQTIKLLLDHARVWIQFVWTRLALIMEEGPVHHAH